jgi:hypothetical protein
MRFLLLRTSPSHPRIRQSKHHKRKWDRKRQVNPEVPRYFHSAVGVIEVESKEAHTEDCLEGEGELVIKKTVPDIQKQMLGAEKSL